MTRTRLRDASYEYHHAHKRMVAAAIIELVECLERGEPVGWVANFVPEADRATMGEPTLLQRIRNIREAVTGKAEPVTWGDRAGRGVGLR